MRPIQSFYRLLVLLLMGFVLSACSRSGASNPFGSSGGAGGGGSSAAGVSYTVQSGGAYLPWHGLPLFEHIQTNETAGVGPVNPLTGFNSIQLSANTFSGCLPTIPAVPCLVPNAYKATGSYRLATCYPNLSACTSIPNDWFTPHGGGYISFDLKIDIPLADVGSAWVYFGNSGCAYSYKISDLQVLNATTAFTRITIPTVGFTAPTNCTLHPDVTAFQLTIFRNNKGSASPALLAIENIVLSI